MPVSDKPQTSLYETIVEDAAIAEALEQREGLRTAASEARRDFKVADDKAKALIAALDLGDGAPVRIGRFVVTRRNIAAKSVSFETEASSRLTISMLDEAA